MTIAENLEKVRIKVAEEAKKAGRTDSPAILAVSKYHPLDAVKEAYDAGQRDFGENYASEGCDKIDAARAAGMCDAVWYFIGPLQANKTRKVAERFDWVMSVDRERVAQRLNDQRPDKMRPIEVCLQVNISGEEQKSGVAPEDAMALAEAVSQMPNLRLRGLMGIALDTDDMNIIESQFAELKKLFESMKSTFPTVDTLSLGMTQDLAAAVKQGSTLVRIGTAIFGYRPKKETAAAK